MPFVVDGRKTYIFTVRWGEERDTDDAEGRVVKTSGARPERAAILGLLPRFTGSIYWRGLVPIEKVPDRARTCSAPDMSVFARTKLMFGCAISRPALSTT